MNSADLLHRARQYPQTDLMAVELAKSLNSTTEMFSRTRELLPPLEKKRRVVSKLNRLGDVILRVSIALQVAMFLGMFSGYLPPHLGSLVLTLAAVGVVAFLVAVGVLFKVESNLRKSVVSLANELNLLSPIAGGDACLAAAQYVQSGDTHVLDWRDYALAERGQLYGFDVEIMRGMYEAGKVEQHADSKAEPALSKEEKLAVACRIAHGLPSSV